MPQLIDGQQYLDSLMNSCKTTWSRNERKPCNARLAGFVGQKPLPGGFVFQPLGSLELNPLIHLFRCSLNSSVMKSLLQYGFLEVIVTEMQRYLLVDGITYYWIVIVSRRHHPKSNSPRTLHNGSCTVDRWNPQQCYSRTPTITDKILFKQKIVVFLGKVLSLSFNNHIL